METKKIRFLCVPEPQIAPLPPGNATFLDFVFEKKKEKKRESKRQKEEQRTQDGRERTL